MPRPRSFDADIALAAVEELFWRQGYEATSYADLMQATGLGKGSLYAAFGDKQALYLKALEGYIAREVGEAGAVLTNPDLPGEARIAAFLEMPIEAVELRSDRRGCFLCNAAVDVAPHDPAAAKIISKALSDAMAAIGVALAASRSARASAEGIFATYLGMRVLAKSGAPVATLRAARDSALLLLVA